MYVHLLQCIDTLHLQYATVCVLAFSHTCICSLLINPLNPYHAVHTYYTSLPILLLK